MEDNRKKTGGENISRTVMTTKLPETSRGILQNCINQCHPNTFKEERSWGRSLHVGASRGGSARTHAFPGLQGRAAVGKEPGEEGTLLRGGTWEKWNGSRHGQTAGKAVGPAHHVSVCTELAQQGRRLQEELRAPQSAAETRKQ